MILHCPQPAHQHLCLTPSFPLVLARPGTRQHHEPVSSLGSLCADRLAPPGQLLFPSRSMPHAERETFKGAMPSWLLPSHPGPVWWCFCSFPVSLGGEVQRDSVFLSGFLSRRSSFLSAALLSHHFRGNWCLSSSLPHQKKKKKTCLISEGYPESRCVCVGRGPSEARGRSEVANTLAWGSLCQHSPVELDPRRLGEGEAGKERAPGAGKTLAPLMEHLCR